MNKTLYLAHPMSGLNGEEMFEYFDNAKDTLSKYYNILSPLTGKEYLRDSDKIIPTGYKHPISNDHAVFQRDTWMVSKSDIVFCDFTGSKTVSIGCCMELAIASWLNKHTIIVITKDNIHNHAFINEAADIVFETFEDGIRYLKELA